MILLNELPCAALITDEKGSVLLVNGALRAIIGGTDDTWHGQPMEVLFPPASRIFLQTHLWPLLLREGSLSEAALVSARPLTRGHAVRQPLGPVYRRPRLSSASA